MKKAHYFGIFGLLVMESLLLLLGDLDVFSGTFPNNGMCFMYYQELIILANSWYSVHT